MINEIKEIIIMKIKLLSIIILAFVFLTSCQPNNTTITSLEIKTPILAANRALALDKTTETKNGYILFGRFYSVGFPHGVVASGESIWDTALITDANGQNISYTYPDGLPLTGETGNFPWAYEIQGKEHAWPLTITFNSVRADVADAQAEFDFDTGSNPQGGQNWVVDRDISIAGYVLHIDSILHTGTGYKLKFTNDHSIASIGVEIVNAETGSACLGGGGSVSGSDGIESRIDCEGEIPSGRVTIRLSNLEVYLQGKWQLQWRPDPV